MPAVVGEALFAPEIPMTVLYKEWDIKKILLKSLEPHRCQQGQLFPTQSTQQDL